MCRAWSIICSRTPCRDLYSQFHFGRCLYHSASGLEMLLSFRLLLFFSPKKHHGHRASINPSGLDRIICFATNLTVSFTTVKDDKDVKPISCEMICCLVFLLCCCGMDAPSACVVTWGFRVPKKEAVCDASDIMPRAPTVPRARARGPPLLWPVHSRVLLPPQESLSFRNVNLKEKKSRCEFLTDSLYLASWAAAGWEE